MGHIEATRELSASPEALWETGRAAHFHAAFTDADPRARAAHHRRIATALPSK